MSRTPRSLPLFGLSYESLPPLARRLFALLGVVPGHDLSVPGAAALFDRSAREVAVLLETLASANLLQRERSRYRMHDLIRLYAARQAQGESGADAAWQRLADWYLRTADAAVDFEYLPGMINSLKAQGYVVISTFQWNESYDSRPSPQQVRDFQLVADAGASIVSGSQAHYAQMMEFHGDSFIHYGLGNLFFDQTGDQDWMPLGIRREFLDRYVIYDGRLISVELITALL